MTLDFIGNTMTKNSAVEVITGFSGIESRAEMVQGVGTSLHANPNIGHKIRFSGVNTPEKGASTAALRATHLKRTKQHTEINLYVLSAPCSELHAAIALNNALELGSVKMNELHTLAVQTFINKFPPAQIESTREEVTALGITITKA